MGTLSRKMVMLYWTVVQYRRPLAQSPPVSPMLEYLLALRAIALESIGVRMQWG